MGKIKAIAWALLIAACCDWNAFAQTPVITQPSVANSSDASSTIGSSLVFQQIWAAVGPSAGSSARRNGCLVINNSITNTQWVYFQGPGMDTPTAGTLAAIKLKSIALSPAPVAGGLGGFVYCSVGGGQTLQDAVWIAGTAGDSYVAKQQ